MVLDPSILATPSTFSVPGNQLAGIGDLDIQPTIGGTVTWDCDTGTPRFYLTFGFFYPMLKGPSFGSFEEITIGGVTYRRGTDVFGGLRFYGYRITGDYNIASISYNSSVWSGGVSSEDYLDLGGGTTTFTLTVS